VKNCRLSPEGWARRAIGGYREFRADRMDAEVSNREIWWSRSEYNGDIKLSGSR
jgi:hypothetical protein